MYHEHKVFMNTKMHISLIISWDVEWTYIIWIWHNAITLVWTNIPYIPILTFQGPHPPWVDWFIQCNWRCLHCNISNHNIYCTLQMAGRGGKKKRLKDNLKSFWMFLIFIVHQRCLPHILSMSFMDHQYTLGNSNVIRDNTYNISSSKDDSQYLTSQISMASKTIVAILN